MSNLIQISYSSKIGALLDHVLSTPPFEVGLSDAATIMGVACKSVSSMLSNGVRSGYLCMTWEKDGLHYKIADGVIVQQGRGPWFDIHLPIPDGYEYDFDSEFLKVRRSWVSANGLPPPVTTGVRSVFDLARSLR